jgi:hypothetical protein
MPTARPICLTGISEDEAAVLTFHADHLELARRPHHLPRRSKKIRLHYAEIDEIGVRKGRQAGTILVKARGSVAFSLTMVPLADLPLAMELAHRHGLNVRAVSGRQP